MLLGKQIDGVWHTSVVVGGTEFFFGCGVQRAVPGSTHFGRPLEVTGVWDASSTCVAKRV